LFLLEGIHLSQLFDFKRAMFNLSSITVLYFYFYVHSFFYDPSKVNLFLETPEDRGVDLVAGSIPKGHGPGFPADPWKLAVS
jgi:hypothetical protein